MWEKIFHFLFRVKPIDSENEILQFRIRSYRGESLLLSNGENLKKGDPIVEIHLNNERVYQLTQKARSDMQLAVWMIREVEGVLPKLVLYLKNHEEGHKVKGVYGITMIYRGTEQLGFQVVDLPSGLFSYFTKNYLRLLLYFMHPTGKKRLKVKTPLLIPKIIVMSTDQLFNRYTIPMVRES